MPNRTPATTSDLPGQASTMTPSATPRRPIRSSNCHVLRASCCSGPSKPVFSLVVMQKRYSPADAKRLFLATELGTSHRDHEQSRSETTHVDAWSAPLLS